MRSAVIVLVAQTLEMNNEPPHDKTNKMIRASSEDSDQPGQKILKLEHGNEALTDRTDTQTVRRV